MLVWLAILSLVLLGAAPPVPSPAETKAEFEAVCRSLIASDDAFFGEKSIHSLQARLKDSKPRSAEVEAGIRGRLAWDLRRVGRTEEAVELLEEARAIAIRENLSRELLLQLERDLGVTYMVFGERQNCSALHRSASCIVPFLPEALHTLPDSAQKAGDHFLAYLKERPEDVQARFLLNVARWIGGDYPKGVPAAYRFSPETFAPEVEMTRWKDRAPELGLAIMDLAGGAVMDDFDADGFLDLISTSSDSCGQMRAFRNDGRGGFEDVTTKWGLEGQLGGLNLVQADYDNDGRLDLLVLRGGWWGANGRIRNSLLRNDLAASGRFLDVTARAGIAFPAYPSQAGSFADYDGDGDLDLYFGNEATGDLRYPSQLFRNNGDGTFTERTDAAGVGNFGYAKSVAWGDVDEDGDPDLFVSNIGPNRLYLNRGDGSFEEVAERIGLEAGEGRRTFASWFFDIDQDGDLDLFNADYGARIAEVSASYMGLGESGGAPHLFLNQGGRFKEVSEAWGLSRPSLPMGANYGDLDNDGWLDVYLATGVPDYEALAPNVVYRNVGGKRLQEITFASGLGHLQKGHGVAFGDIDGDGDQDLFHQIGGQYPGDGYANALFENPGPSRSWVTLRFIGKKANHFAVGGRVSLLVKGKSGERSLYRRVGTGGSFGGSSLQQEIGLDDATEILQLEMRWPGSGTVQMFRGLEIGATYQVTEGEAELLELETGRLRLGGSPEPP